MHETFYRAMSTLVQSPHRDTDTQRLLKVRRFRYDFPDIWGILERGEFGISARGVDNQTYRRTYYRSVNDAELLPLYFRFHLPHDSNIGILILQRLGVHGAFGHLNRVLQDEFRRSHGNHILEIRRFVPSSVLRELRRGAIREVSVVTHSVPRDIADVIRLRGMEIDSDIGVIETRIRAKRKGVLWNRAPRWVSQLDADRVTVAEIFGDNVKSVRLRVKYGDQERAYVFSHQESLAPYIDVTDDITILDNGHPSFRSIDKYSLNLRDELIEQLGRENRHVRPAS